VGLAVKRWRVSHLFLIADLAFWFTLGLVLGAIFYSGPLALSAASVEMVVFKQSIKGIGNASRAFLLPSLVRAGSRVFQWKIKSATFREACLVVLLSLGVLPGITVWLLHVDHYGHHVIDRNITARQLENGNAATSVRYELKKVLSSLESAPARISLEAIDQAASRSQELAKLNDIVLIRDWMGVAYPMKGDMAKLALTAASFEGELWGAPVVHARGSQDLPTIHRAELSYLIFSSSLGEGELGTGWVLETYSPLKGVLFDLHSAYRRGFLLLLLSCAPVVIFAMLLSKALSRPIVEIEAVARQLVGPVQIDTAKMSWPEEGFLEIRSLSERLKTLIQSVQAAVQAQERVAADLTQLVETANAPIFGIDTAERVNESNQTAQEHTLSRILEPFFTTKNIGEGTGLGLSVSYGIVRDMGGDIVATTSAEGATFTIRMPIIDTKVAS
jgi:hypothetical protein